MKPNFALKLSNDGAQLLHRAGAVWTLVGSVSFQDDDIAAACAKLVADAGVLAPEGLFTKLVIPASELRYAAVVAPGPTDEARRYQIEAEVERLTPYALDELVYDFSIEGDQALVAICARETLAEAETFADGYGFRPVSFVAVPEPGQFNGEPWFGESMVAKGYLPSGAKVQRDAEPIRISLARPAAARATPAPAPATPMAPVTAPAVPPAAVTPPVAKAPVSPSAPAAPAAVMAPASPRPVPPRPPAAATPAAAPATPVKPAEKPALPLAGPAEAARATMGDLVRRMGTRLRRERSEAATPAPVAPVPAPPAAPVTTVRPATVVPPVAPTPAPGMPAASPASPPAPAGPEPVAFASRRRPAVATSGSPTEAPQSSPGGRIAVLTPPAKPGPSVTARLVAKAQGVSQGAVARLSRLGPKKAESPAPLVAQSRPPLSDKDRQRESEALTLFGARGQAPARPAFARRGLMAAGGVLALLLAVAIWTVYVQQDEPTSLADAGTSAETAAPIQPPGTLPEASASVSEPAPLTAEAPAPTAAPDTAPAETAPPETAPAETAAEAASDPDALLERLAEAARDETVTLPAQPEVAAQPETQPNPEPQPLTTAEAPTEPQPAAPAPEPEQLAEAPTTQATGIVEQRLSLPGAPEAPPDSETPFAPPPPPPPFGSTFAFDAQGLVEATPEGALTPSGVTVFARRPAVAPAPAPGRPAEPGPEGATLGAPAEPAVTAAAPVEVAPTDTAIAAAAPATTEPAPTAPETATSEPAAPEAPPTDVVYDDTPRADPALANARPGAMPARIRTLRDEAAAAPPPPATAPAPDDQTLLETAPPPGETLADSAAAETPPPGGLSLAALRPQRRPSDLVPQVAVAPQPTDEAAPETAPEAVAESPIPGARPDTIQERARQILAAASAPASTSASTPDEIETDEGESASSASAPSIPSSASVARQATETDAIRLGDINLIGVFGTPNDRRALVRLSSGRVVRVGVGDRLDGGQVTAIGETELRYSNGGRNEVLRIGG